MKTSSVRQYFSVSFVQITTYLSLCTWRRLSRHRCKYGLRYSNTCWTEINILPRRNVHCKMLSKIRFFPTFPLNFPLFAASITLLQWFQQALFCLQLEKISCIIKCEPVFCAVTFSCDEMIKICVIWTIHKCTPYTPKWCQYSLLWRLDIFLS